MKEKEKSVKKEKNKNKRRITHNRASKSQQTNGDQAPTNLIYCNHTEDTTYRKESDGYIYAP